MGLKMMGAVRAVLSPIFRKSVSAGQPASLRPLKKFATPLETVRKVRTGPLEVFCPGEASRARHVAQRLCSSPAPCPRNKILFDSSRPHFSDSLYRFVRGSDPHPRDVIADSVQLGFQRLAIGDFSRGVLLVEGIEVIPCPSGSTTTCPRDVPISNPPDHFPSALNTIVDGTPLSCAVDTHSVSSKDVAACKPTLRKAWSTTHKSAAGARARNYFSRSSASRYLARVLATTSAGRSGPGAVLFHDVSVLR
jgi:hypothetical protein